MTTVVQEVARRFVVAQSWWIASEIARRHPRIQIVETHPCSGQYDCLDLVELHDRNVLGSLLP